MIHSSAVDGHHFLLSRRRGYDPAEVDAVLKRLVATLRKYEDRDAEFNERIAGAVPSVTDLDSVRAARDEVLQNAEAVGHQLELEARTRLEEIERLITEDLNAAHEEATRIIESARAEANNMLARRNKRAEALITAALSEVKALRARVLHETNEYRAGGKTESAALLRTAELRANQILEDARHEAGSVLGRARREHMMLEQRIGRLRSTVAGIEGQFRHLAETTLEQTDIMSTMIALEADDLEDPLDDNQEEPDVVRLTQRGVTVDLTDEDSEEPVPKQPLDERYVVAPGNTIYQRRGGGLRRRLEEEDVSELPE
ncbi:MAG: DivIVA domain-containing protein [Actinomycetota bacterium]|nr:DivIVA domain-containing protein [Actinomycetota bacterium]